MRLALSLVAWIVLAAGAALLAPPAQADNGAPPPPPPPRWTPRGPAPTPLPGPAPAPGAARPPAVSLVPVPDVRGMPEVAARRAIVAAGLRVGGVERLSLDRLESELGHRYAPGIVVQQSPPPSVGETPRWQPRGSEVWLRMSAGVPVAPASPAPTEPTVPVVPVPPTPRTPYTGTPPPPPPPPTYQGPQPTQPAPLVPPVTPAPTTAPPPSPESIWAPPPPMEADLIGALPSRIRLPCERRRDTWHVRLLGGGAFSLGDDSSAFGVYAGADVGHTFSGCLGVDVFYRYHSGTFDRVTGTGVLEDGGDTHHIGAKVTYESSFDRTSQLYWWVGAGPEYFWTSGFTTEDDGIAGYGEVGIGYMLSNDARVRFGVGVHGMRSSAGRRDAIDDGQSRFLWTVAPMLVIEFNL